MSDSSPTVRAETWFLDLRKVAFLAGVANGLSALIPIWNALHALGAAGGLALLLELVSLLGSVLMPIFLVALHRDEGALRIPRHLRLLALAGAVVFTCMICWSLPPWIGQPGIDAIYYVSLLLTEISNVGMVLVLIALFRTGDGATATNAPVSNFLRVVTRATVVVWGMWLAFNLFRGLMAPYAYLQVRDYAARIGRAAPTPIDIVGDLLLGILNAAIFFSVPYIVSKGIASAPAPDASPIGGSAGSCRTELENRHYRVLVGNSRKWRRERSRVLVTNGSVLSDRARAESQMRQVEIVFTARKLDDFIIW